MCLYREAEALNSEIRHPGSVHCSFTVFWYCQSQGTSREWAVPLLRKVPQRDIYHLLKGSLPMRTTWKTSLQQVLDLHKAEFKGDEFFSCISMSARKVEDNDTLVSQSAHLKITGVGTAVKVLWRGTKVSGRKEFEINKLGASQVLGNIFPWEEERQELWKKKLVLDIIEVQGNSYLLPNILMFNPVTKRSLGCWCVQKHISHAKVSSAIKIYQVFQDNGKHRLSLVCKRSYHSGAL